jgi:iron complex transport system permease protein
VTALAALPLPGEERRRWIVLALLAALVAAVALGLVVGAAPVAPSALWALARGVTDDGAAILLQIRLPRVGLGVVVGAALAVAGVLMQGLFRNPLADPSLLGLSGGAALGAAAAIVLAPHVAGAALAATPALALVVTPLAAFAGAWGAALALGVLARGAHAATVAMLLAGVALNAIASAGTSALAFIASDAELRAFSQWTMGSLGAATWPLVAATAAPVAVALPLALRRARALDVLALGEREAGHLGVDVDRLGRQLVVLAAALVGAAVAAAGLVGFVGVLVPHALRVVAGARHTFLVVAGALLGGVVLVVADAIARTAFAPAELPVGVLTALAGAPSFLALLARARRSEP